MEIPTDLNYFFIDERLQIKSNDHFLFSKANCLRFLRKDPVTTHQYDSRLSG